MSLPARCLALLALSLLPPGAALARPPAPPEDLPPARAAEVAWGRERLAPYFADGPLQAAKQAFDQRRYAEARTLLLGVEPTPPGRFLAALAALRAGDAAAAGAGFEGLAPDYPPLEDRCWLLAGQAHEQRLDWAAAERAYGRVRSASRVGPEAALGRARALRQAGQPAVAAALLAPLAERPAPPWGRDLGAEALLELAEARAAARDAKGAREAWLALWSQHPATAQARRAAERLGDAAALPPAAVVARAEGLVDAHRNAEGEALVLPLLEKRPPPDPLGCRAGLAAGRAQRKQRAHLRAIATLAPVVKGCTEPELRARARYVLGVSQSFAAPAQAAATFEALAAEAPENPLADDALLLAADARRREGQGEAASGLLRRLIEAHPGSASAADALFRLFWQAHAEGREEAALEVLDALEARSLGQEEPFEVQRARYWRARVLEGLGRGEEAVALHEDLAREHPASYYGLIARERVELLAPARGEALLAATAAEGPGVDPLPLRAGPLAEEPTFLAAVELARLGLGELATQEILALDRTGLDREALQLLVVVLSVGGEERAAHGLARLWLRAELSGPITRDRRALWEIAYPRPYREAVLGRPEERGALDPDLLQALMREESALDPKALSWAGALGLCQLMPGTAAEVAARLKLPRPSPARLFEPELNIRLGGWYLAELLRRAGGVTQLALAGYNAGEAAVARWRRENGEADLAAWVEQIPVAETRAYVRRVLRSYATYKLLYDPSGVPRTRQGPVLAGGAPRAPSRP